MRADASEAELTDFSFYGPTCDDMDHMKGPFALPGDVKAGLELTGHFLEQFVFHALNKPLPPARVWMIDKLGEAGRL